MLEANGQELEAKTGLINAEAHIGPTVRAATKRVE
jgi:hypothetical protein